MNYQDEIIAITNRNDYSGYDADEFKQALKVETVEAFTQMMKDLNALQEDYILIRNEKDHRYYALKQLDCIVGKVSIHQSGHYGFVENEEGSVYVGRDEITKCLEGDEVLAKVSHHEDGSSDCCILSILKHHKHTLVGIIRKTKRTLRFLSDEAVHRPIKITNTDAFKLMDNMKVQVQIDEYGDVLKCSILQILGYKDDPGVDILSTLLEHDIDPVFPKAVIQEANQLSETISAKERKRRLDLTKELIITIDGDDSKDLDDAVSVKKLKNGYRLGVHIADVSYYVKAGSALDKEAYKRATSVYVVDRVVPMLPQALSNNICSLNPKVERLTLSCIMDIDKTGKVLNYTLAPSIIKTTERMTYKNVNKILAQDEKACRKYKSIVPMVHEMERLSLILRKKRRNAGAIDFDTKESEILVDKQGKVKDIHAKERGESERIIEDFMIMANETVAAHTKFMELPSMYRIHEAPDPKKLKNFATSAMLMGHPLQGDVHHIYPKQLQDCLDKAKGEACYPVLSTLMLRSMQKAKYDVSCLGHFGLGLSEYTHFTSPIRRYPDLVVHRMLRKYYFNTVEDPKVYDKDIRWIESAAMHASSQERNAIDAERSVEDMKKCEYMSRFIGKKFKGIVSSVTKFGLFVELENTCEGLVRLSDMDGYYVYHEETKTLSSREGKTYRIGQEVVIQVVGVNKLRQEVDFVLIQEKQRKRK